TRSAYAPPAIDITRSPTARPVTRSPTSRISPAQSSPPIGRPDPRASYVPRRMSRSARFTDAARTAMTTLPGPASGSGASPSSSRPPSGEGWTKTAFIPPVNHSQGDRRDEEAERDPGERAHEAVEQVAQRGGA